MTWESLQVGGNIKLIDWAPQTDVLAHPGVQAFLTQSGINSLYEAASHAVPMVSVPLIGDQINNAAKVTHFVSNSFCGVCFQYKLFCECCSIAAIKRFACCRDVGCIMH